MKCSILSKIFGTCLLAALSLNYSYAEEVSYDNLTKVEMRCRCHHHHSSSSSEIIPQIRFTRFVVESINLWQERSVYLKAGIESIAKDTIGDELTYINEQLTANSLEINRLISNASLGNCSNNSLNVLLDRQNALIFDYVRSLISGTTAEQTDIVNALEVNTRRIANTIKKETSHQSRLGRIDALLNSYLATLIQESQNFVTAINTTLPPGTLADFKPAYNSYVRSINLGERIGRLIGLTFEHSDRN